MIQNLFSVLSEEQLNRLTKSERDALYAIDQKLFPDYDKYVDEYTKQKSVVERVLERRKAEEQSDRAYSEQLQSQFV